MKRKSMPLFAGILINLLVWSNHSSLAANAPVENKPEPTDLSHQEQDNPLEPLTKIDRKFIASFSVFTSSLYVSSKIGADSNSCDALDELYNDITDEAWTCIDQILARIWNTAHQKAAVALKKGKSSKDAFIEAHSLLAKMPDESIIRLAKAYSPLVANYAKQLDFTKLDLDSLHANQLKVLFEEVLKYKKEHDIIAAYPLVIEKLNETIKSKTIKSSFGSDSAFIRKELKHYAKMIGTHYINKDGIKDFVDSNITPNGPIGVGVNNMVAEVLKQNVSYLTDKLVEKGVDDLFDETNNNHLTPLNYIKLMKASNAIYESSDLEDSQEFYTGEEAFQPTTVEGYLRKVGHTEIEILWSASEKTTNKLLKKFVLRKHLTGNFFRMVNFDDGFTDRPGTTGLGMFAEKMIKDLSEGLLKQSVKFIFNGVSYYVVPKTPSAKPVGLVLKDGVYHHVYRNPDFGKDKTDNSIDPVIEELLNKYPVLSGDDIKEQRFAIGQTVIRKKTQSEKVAIAVGTWMADSMLDSTADFVSKLMLEGGMNAIVGKQNPATLNRRIWDNDTQDIHFKLINDVNKRLITTATKFAASKIGELVLPKKEIVGLALVDGVYRYVHQ